MVSMHYKIMEKSRRAEKISERHIPVSERPRECVPTGPPSQRKIEIVERATVTSPRVKRLTDNLNIENPTNLRFLIKNLQIENKERFLQTMLSDESVTIVSDGGLNNHGVLAGCRPEMKKF